MAAPTVEKWWRTTENIFDVAQFRLHHEQPHVCVRDGQTQCEQLEHVDVDGKGRATNEGFKKKLAHTLVDATRDATRLPAWADWLCKRYPAIDTITAHLSKAGNAYVKVTISPFTALDLPGEEVCPRHVFVPLHGVLEAVPVVCEHEVGAVCGSFDPRRGDRYAMRSSKGEVVFEEEEDEAACKAHQQQLLERVAALRTLRFVSISFWL